MVNVPNMDFLWSCRVFIGGGRKIGCALGPFPEETRGLDYSINWSGGAVCVVYILPCSRCEMRSSGKTFNIYRTCEASRLDVVGFISQVLRNL